MVKKNKRKTGILLVLLAIIPSFAFAESPVIHPFYNEQATYKILWKGIPVGSVNMKTKILKGTDLLRAYAKVSTFGALQSIYYIAGEVGSEWNYKSRTSYRAFETVYQGKKYQKRFYLFKGNRVLVKKNEKNFAEHGFPHSGKAKGATKERKWVNAPGFHDLIGAMYWLRSSNIPMRAGHTIHLPVLPAGSKKYLIIKVLRRKKVNTALGSKHVYHVRSGLADNKNLRVGSGGDMLIKTKSPIDMFITDDKDRLMVKAWTKVEVAGKVEVELAKYSQR